VILVAGPTHLTVSHSLVQVIPVVTAQEMYEACHQYFDEMDVVIAAAAVADYKPKIVATQKIKKRRYLVIELEKTKDILASLER
jgi:phosphopantothenoylcysteine decarboxylase/phosphopantothenate--cysteine ligase